MMIVISLMMAAMSLIVVEMQGLVNTSSVIENDLCIE